MVVIVIAALFLLLNFSLNPRHAYSKVQVTLPLDLSKQDSRGYTDKSCSLIDLCY